MGGLIMDPNITNVASEYKYLPQELKELGYNLNLFVEDSTSTINKIKNQIKEINSEIQKNYEKIDELSGQKSEIEAHIVTQVLTQKGDTLTERLKGLEKHVATELGKLKDLDSDIQQIAEKVEGKEGLLLKKDKLINMVHRIEKNIVKPTENEPTKVMSTKSPVRTTMQNKFKYIKEKIVNLVKSIRKKQKTEKPETYSATDLRRRTYKYNDEEISKLGKEAGLLARGKDLKQSLSEIEDGIKRIEQELKIEKNQENIADLRLTKGVLLQLKSMTAKEIKLRELETAKKPKRPAMEPRQKPATTTSKHDLEHEYLEEAVDELDDLNK